MPDTFSKIQSDDENLDVVKNEPPLSRTIFG